MEVGESSGVARRKRTESNGGSSDSDLSEGWNFVDQLDVNNHEVPSSDGESVEVIEADDSQEHGEGEAEGRLVTQDGQLSSVPDFPLVPAAEHEPLEPSDVETPADHEEMFDSSFCWFLFFATSAVLVSNLAFMVADHALEWNKEGTIDSPSFLRDLPITSKPARQDTLPHVISWADNEEATVDTVEDTINVGQNQGKYVDRYYDKHNEVNNQQDSKDKRQKQSSKIDIHEVRKYFKVLNDITTSDEAQNKFDQALLILDALQVGLNDLDEAVTDSSELHHVLQKQKHKLQEVITQVKFGVSRTVEKLATNVLNKVYKLEKKFENQWCKLEKNGHKEELKGLFYDCIEREVDSALHIKKAKSFEENNKLKKVKNKRTEKKRMIMDDLHYAVDKDTNGKMYSKPSSWEKNNEEYHNFVKQERFENEIYVKKHKHENSEKKDDYRNKFSKGERDDKEKFSKQSDKHAKPTKPSINKLENIVLQTKNEKPNFDDKSVEFKLSKYFKENCNTNEKHKQFIKYVNKYQESRNNVDEKFGIPKNMFNFLYEKYCKPIDGNENQFKKENLKGEFRGKHNSKKIHTIIDDNKGKIKNVVEVRIIETSKTNNEANLFNAEGHKVIPANKPRQWILSYEGSPSDGKSNMSADWFFRAGESRSKTRWSHHRGDWWFERSSNRRSQPHPPVWLTGRRKNWFFRRAWARHQCRQSPHDDWCHLPQDETLTIPNPSANLR